MATIPGAVATKDLIRSVSEESFRAAAKLVNANAGVSTALKSELGISVTPAVPSPVAQPLELSATGYENGSNKLTWKRNGNPNTTTFLVEYRMGGSAAWNLVGVTSKTKYTHATPTLHWPSNLETKQPRNSEKPSNQSTLYGPEEDVVVSLKKAA